MHRKPDGSYTASNEEYIEAWDDLGQKVLSFFPDYYLGGFDPDLLLHPKNQSYSSFTLPLLACVSLAKRYEEILAHEQV